MDFNTALEIAKNPESSQEQLEELASEVDDGSLNKEDIEIIRRFKTITDKVDGRIFSDYRDFNIDLAIYDTKISIASFSEHPFLVLIDSEELVKTLKPIFDLVWK